MDGLYTISEMAQIFGISRQTLIYYDRTGLFSPAYVNDEGYRFYAPTQIPSLRLICLLKDLGLELKEIKRISTSHDVDTMVAYLDGQERELEDQIGDLEEKLSRVVQRRRFYNEVARWRRTGGRPVITHYPERYVIFEPWGVPGENMGREHLHPALMRAISRLRDADKAAPVAGWGTMVLRDSFAGPDVFQGAGSFVTVPEGVDPAKLTGVVMLPEGEYVCQGRWGMPYDETGIQRLLSWMCEHRFEPAGNAFDFCLLDATSYTEQHREDYCCMQIPIAF